MVDELSLRVTKETEQSVMGTSRGKPITDADIERLADPRLQGAGLARRLGHRAASSRRDWYRGGSAARPGHRDLLRDCAP